MAAAVRRDLRAAAAIGSGGGDEEADEAVKAVLEPAFSCGLNFSNRSGKAIASPANTRRIVKARAMLPPFGGTIAGAG